MNLFWTPKVFLSWLLLAFSFEPAILRMTPTNVVSSTNLVFSQSKGTSPQKGSTRSKKLSKLFLSRSLASSRLSPESLFLALDEHCVLYLDASNSDSYPGTGRDWFDLSNYHNHVKLPLSDKLVWNKDDGSFSTDVDTPIEGPTSDRFNLGIDTTVIVVAQSQSSGRNTFLVDLKDKTNTQNMIRMTLPWSNNVIYYDVHGCCDVYQRVSYSASSFTKSHYVFRTRTSKYPHREIFENGKSKVTSSNYPTNNFYEWGGKSFISENWKGILYLVQFFNRALSDEEIQQHYAWAQSRFKLS